MSDDAYDAADGARRYAKRGIEELKATVAQLDSRLQTVEKLAHAPFDFADIVKRLEALERWQDFVTAAAKGASPGAAP